MAPLARVSDPDLYGSLAYVFADLDCPIFDQSELLARPVAYIKERLNPGRAVVTYFTYAQNERRLMTELPALAEKTPNFHFFTSVKSKADGYALRSIIQDAMYVAAKTMIVTAMSGKGIIIAATDIRYYELAGYIKRLGANVTLLGAGPRNDKEWMANSEFRYVRVSPTDAGLTERSMIPNLPAAAVVAGTSLFVGVDSWKETLNLRIHGYPVGLWSKVAHDTLGETDGTYGKLLADGTPVLIYPSSVIDKLISGILSPPSNLEAKRFLKYDVSRRLISSGVVKPVKFDDANASSKDVASVLGAAELEALKVSEPFNFIIVPIYLSLPADKKENGELTKTDDMREVSKSVKRRKS